MAAGLNRPLGRDRSLDALKGAGILLVVAGHIFSGAFKDAVYLFHMPLFFFIGGYLFRPQADWPSFTWRKSRQYLVPYFAFLALIFVPSAFFGLKSGRFDNIGDAALTGLWGGAALDGWAGVFWFMTVYFLTVVLYNFLHSAAKGALTLVMVASLAGAYAYSRLAMGFDLPWNAQVVLMSLPFFHGGFLFRSRLEPGLSTSRAQAIAIVVAGLVIGAVIMELLPGFRMKSGLYGIPVVTFLAALACIIALFSMRKQFMNWEPLGKSLAALGSASLIIMYLHQPIQLILAQNLGLTDPYLRFVGAVLLSWGAYRVILAIPLLHPILLGTANRRSERSIAPEAKAPIL